jgi:hypothetical protein
LESTHSNSLHNDRQYDSGFYDSASFDTGAPPLVQAGLVDWQLEILRLWSANIGRYANKTDIVLLSGILEAKQEAISANLKVILNQKKRMGDLEGALVPPLVDKAQSSWLQDSSIDLGAWEEDRKTIEDATALFDNTQFPNHAMNLLPFTGTYDVGYDQTLAHDQSSYTGPSSANEVLLTDDINALAPVLRTTDDLSKERHIDQADPDSVTASYVPAWISHTSDLDMSAISCPRLRQLIGQIISRKAAKGCGPILRYTHPAGRFSCTLGCGRRFRAAGDTFRHEEIVYPQKFWFCLECGDPNDPAEKYVFTRKDKMRKHIKRLNHAISVDQCRVPNIRTLYPERCAFCSNHWHTDWKERCKHLIRHCKRGDFAASAHTAATGQVPSSIDNNDDDGDDNDDDDENDDGDDDESESPYDEPDEESKEEDSNGEGPSDPNRKHNTSGDDYDRVESSTKDTDVNYGDWLQDSPGFSISRSVRHFLSLQPAVNVINAHVWASQKPIDWLEQRPDGSIASAFGMRSHLIVNDNACSEPRTIFIGNYRYTECCLHEGMMELLLALDDPNCKISTVIRHSCTFVVAIEVGEKQYNLVLEHDSSTLDSAPIHTGNISGGSMSSSVAGKYRLVSLHKLEPIVGSQQSQDPVIGIQSGTTKSGVSLASKPPTTGRKDRMSPANTIHWDPERMQRVLSGSSTMTAPMVQGKRLSLLPKIEKDRAPERAQSALSQADMSDTLQFQSRPKLSKAMLAHHARYYDTEKEHDKYQLKIHDLQVAARQLGFELSKDKFEPDKWQWGVARSTRV